MRLWLFGLLAALACDSKLVEPSGGAESAASTPLASQPLAASTHSAEAGGRIERDRPDGGARTLAPLPSSPRPTTAPPSAYPSAEAAPVAVTGVERYGAKDSARIVVFMTEQAQHQVGSLEATGELGPRLYVDIPGAVYTGRNHFEVGGIVQRVRTGEADGRLRIVLDLQQKAYKRVFYLPEPPRLVVDVSRHPPRSAWQRRNGEREVRRVVLDPGHGGHDPGAIGGAGLEEKDVALDVAHRAAPLLARELGIDTLLTRDGDEYVALDERVAKANAFAADLFISIHCNASESSESHGVMSFVLDASGDAVSHRIAARENFTSRAAAADFASSVRSVLDTATARSSLRFAELLQRASLSSLTPFYRGVHDGGVRRAGFYVLAGAHMPAVLFEVSFISNPTEETRLDSDHYRQKIADGIVNAVRAYRAGR